MDKTIKVGLVEDQELFRQGIKALIDSWQEFDVVFESSDGYSTLQKLATAAELPYILLVDISLPKDPETGREYSGIDLLRELKVRFPQILVLMLSVQEDRYVMAQCIEMGANGYLLKDSDPMEVREAIWTVNQHGSYINGRTLDAIQMKLTGRVKTKQSHDQLTQREIEVLKLICQQLTAEEIGERLFISPKTVNGHRNNLLQKTGSRNLAGLVMYAVKNGIVEFE